MTREQRAILVSVADIVDSVRKQFRRNDGQPDRFVSGQLSEASDLIHRVIAAESCGCADEDDADDAAA